MRRNITNEKYSEITYKYDQFEDDRYQGYLEEWVFEESVNIEIQEKFNSLIDLAR